MFGDRAPFSKGLNECSPLSQGLHLALKMASRKQQKKAKFGGGGGGEGWERVQIFFWKCTPSHDSISTLFLLSVMSATDII